MARTKGSKNKVQKTGMAIPSPLMAKEATLNKSGQFSVTQAPSMFYSPELTSESWLLPKSRQEILKWARIFFNLEPYVQSIIMLHSRYPFSKFELTTPDKSVTQFYTDMAFNENFDLYSFILEASLSYHKFGEAIMFGNMEKDEQGRHKWSKFILLEPELVEVKNDMFSSQMAFELIPTEDLKKLVKSEKSEDIARKEQLQKEAPEIINAITEGRNIKLDDKLVSMVFRKTDPSATRGTSAIQALFKPLIYQDWIRLAQTAYAQRYVFPIELWTVGDLATNIMPTNDDLNNYRNLINQSIQNPPFTIVSSPLLKYEALSTAGKNFPVNNEYDYIHDQLMVGLGVNKNLITGDGPNFSNMKGLALQRLVMEYKVIRDQFEQWMIYKFFKPIAEKNKFYTTVGDQKKLILPQISWYKSLDIEEQEAERDAFIDLHGKGFISTETLFSKFPSLDYASEQKKLEKEIGTIWDHGDDRLPAKVSKPSGGGGSGGGGGSMNIGDISPEPIEPIEPTEKGDEKPADKEPVITPDTQTIVEETTQTTETAPGLGTPAV